jgi:hypothetical protein
LHAFEAGIPAPFGNAIGLGDAPGRPVRNTCMAHKCARREVVKRAQRFFQGRHPIVGMYLVEVDVIRLQALQAGPDRIHDVPTRCAAIVWSGARRIEHFGRDDDVLARHAEVLQSLAQHAFCVAMGIDVGGVEDIDAGVQAAPHDVVGRRLVHPGDIAIQASLCWRTECHRAEAQFGYE